MSYTRHSLGISRGNRILEPHRLYGLKHFRHVDGVPYIVFPVSFDAEIDVGADFFANRFHRLTDATEVAVRQPASVRIMPWLFVLGIGGRRDAVALKLERGPSEFLGFGFADLVTPLLHIFRVLHHLKRSIEADAI